jgi:thiamine-monophosphate kinase
MADTHGNTPLGEGHEFNAIRAFLTEWGDLASGIGDDAAIVDVPRGDKLVVSVDAFVAGRHFEPAWLTAKEIGYRATAAALSDLAAMAALPLGILWAINTPHEWRDRLTGIADGVGQAVRDVRAKIVGGNIAAAAELSITITVLGHAREGLGRRGAVTGNHMYVTGALGGPGAAVSAWKRGAEPTEFAHARFVHPVPRIHEARWLADHGAMACIDISDGVIADAGHIAVASGKQLEIHIDRLPTIDGVTVAEAAKSGEEYELLVAAPELDVRAFRVAFGLDLTEIGAVVDGPAGVTTFEAGARVARVLGHDHFSE